MRNNRHLKALLAQIYRIKIFVQSVMHTVLFLTDVLLHITNHPNAGAYIQNGRADVPYSAPINNQVILQCSMIGYVYIDINVHSMHNCTLYMYNNYSCTDISRIMYL